MDIDALISEICSKVQDKINVLEEREHKPRLLILTGGHGAICHEALESTRIARYYKTECALLQDYQCNMDDYEGVVAYTLTNEYLGKIANGIFDSGYTRLFGEALLRGKKIFIPEEEVELWKSKDTGWKAYYQRLEEHIALLKESGVVFGANESLEDLILVPETCGQNRLAPERSGSFGSPCVQEKEVCVFKRVITERDVSMAHGDKASVLSVDPKAIITDLAREYAARQNIAIIRREISSQQRG